MEMGENNTTKKEQNNKNSIDNHYSKIDDIYIELFNFSFSHGPTDSSSDQPFIGRKKIQERLKAILTQTKSKTGAYMITGHRGMGKSSFVNHVVDEIQSAHKPTYYWLKLLSLWVLLMISAYFIKGINVKSINDSENLTYTFLFGLYFIIFLFFRIRETYFWPIIFKENEKKFTSVLTKTKYKFIHGLKTSLIRPLLLNELKFPIKKYKNVTNYIYCYLLIICIYFFIQKINNPYLFFTEFVYVLLLLKMAHLFHLNYKKNAQNRKLVYKSKNKLNKDENIPVKLCPNCFLHVIKDVIVYPFQNYFNYARNLFIKINVGYDDLKETDILRLFARTISNEYANYIKTFRKSFIWKITFFTLLYAFCWYIFYATSIEEFSYQYNERITEWLPSQDLCLLKNTKPDTNCNINNIYYNAIKINNEKRKVITTDRIYSLNTAGEIQTYNKISPVIVNQNSVATSDKNSNIVIVLKKITIGIDRFVTEIYSFFYKIVTEIILLNIHFNDNFNRVPFHMAKHINYFFILFFFFLWGIVWIISRYNIFNINNHRLALRRLNDLNERIVSNVKMERGTSVSNGSSLSVLFSYFRRRSRNYPIADVREIEKELIEILTIIDYIPEFLYKPSIIFIIDELDKIEPQSNVIIGDKESESTASIHKHNPSFSPEGTRERQQAIQKMLSNLKYFLTTAKAKFIFIAGREMYDASLADVSDRNFFVGSIFNDVINVDSFLTDDSDKKLSDITSMTEQFVCRYIIPPEYLNNPLDESFYTLKTYNQYLKCNHDELNDENFEDKNEKYLALIKRERIIFVLRQFIIYLTHNSNGAPKKISSYFEKHIEYFKAYDNANKTVIKKYKGKTLFLVFDETVQYKLGLIHYLTSPVILSIINTIKGYDDKLLVSASFLVDHLLKYHRYAFSWRNIEFTPELLEINKTPELRGFISTMIQYLSQMHIQELLSGLHTYRFNKRISYEISYLSKISEEASATFNFTLDESQALKQYYHDLLHRMETRYKYIFAEDNRAQYIHSISSIHMTIGDLYFYDEEFNDAIIEYQDAIEFLRRIDYKKNKGDERYSINHILLLLRNMLKLGLAYEKRKAFDTAYFTFAELTSLLVNYRNIEIEELGLEEWRRLDTNEKVLIKTSKPKYLENFYNEIEPKSYIVNSNNELEITNSIFIPIKDKEFHTRLTDRFTPLKEDILNKISSFEGIRLIYQPLLAKLQIMEKSHLGGITSTDVFRMEKEFDFLQKTLNKKEMLLTTCDFCNKAGDILYYKNGFLSPLVPKCDKKSYITDEPWGSDEKEFCLAYNKNKGKCSFSSDSIEQKKNNGIKKNPCIACYYYFIGIKLYLKTIIDNLNNADDKIKSNDNIYKLLKVIKCDDFPFRNSSSFIIIASLLSDLGDCYFSCISENDLFRDDFLTHFLKLIKENEKKDSKSLRIETFLATYYKLKRNNELMFKKSESVLLLYYASAQFYKKADEHRAYSWQYTKMLYFLKEILSIINKDEGNLLREELLKLIMVEENVFDPKLEIKESVIEKTIVAKAIKGIYAAYENINVSELNINKALLELKQNEYSDLNRLSISVDIKEVNTIYENLKLQIFSHFKKNEKNNVEIPEKMLSDNVLNYNVSKFSIISTMYNRMLKLQLKAKVNYMILTSKLNYQDRIKIFDQDNIEQTFHELLKPNGALEPYKTILNVKNKGDVIVFLFSDSIYCLHEITKLGKTYGVSYIYNYSFLGATHEKLLTWTYWLNKFFSCNNNGYKQLYERIMEKLKFLLGEDQMQYINPNYQCEMAINCYQSACETHTEGRAYKNQIENMSFLNDDYNDKTYHFCAAIERFSINNDKVSDRIKNLKSLYKNSRLYKNQYYQFPQKVRMKSDDKKEVLNVCESWYDWEHD